MGKKKKSSPSPTVKKNNLNNNIFQTKGKRTTDFQIDANLELVNDDFEQNEQLKHEETVVKEMEDNKQELHPSITETNDNELNSLSSIQEEETTTKDKKQKVDSGTKDGRLITKDEEVEEQLTEEKTMSVTNEEMEEIKENTSVISETDSSEEQQSLKDEQKRLEKEYSKTSLKERVWLTVSPLAVVGLIAYYTNIGILALQDPTISIEDDTTVSVEIETPSTETETETEIETPVTTPEENVENQTEQTPTEPISPETQEPKTYKGFANYKSLNVRSEPSQTSPIVGSLTLNQEVEILELATGTLNWHKINYNGQEAYVREDFITIPENQ